MATLLARFRKGGLRPALGFAAVALLVLAPFYARIVSQTGNPVFPYFTRWFGTSAWSESLDPLAAKSADAGAPGGPLQERLERFRHPVELVRIPWRLVTRGGGFGQTPPLSPLLLLLAPFFVWGAWTGRRARPVAFLAALYGLAWYFFYPDKRYLLLVLPAALLVAATALDGSLRRIAGPGRPSRPGPAAAVALALLAPGMLWAVWTLARRGALPVTARERDAYVSRFVRVYPALEALNRVHGDGYTVYGLFCENAAYFARGRFLGDFFGPYRYELVTSSLGDSGRLRAALRGMGATHLLVSEESGPVSLPPDPAFPLRFRALPSPRGTRLFALAPVEPRGPISSSPKTDPKIP